MTATSDTIVAPATPPGRGGIGVIRISGPLVPELAQRLLGACPKPRYAKFSRFTDQQGQVLDEGLALYFPAPHSFTGEDVLELQGHGGPVVIDQIVQAVLAMGARLAKPGEFSERAFLNDKIDLTQAEAIADLIDSSSQQAARSALRSLQGEFSQRINTFLEALIELRMFVEAAIDFPEEEIDYLTEGHVALRVQTLLEQLHAIQTSAQQGVLLQEGLTVVLAGQPNVGKSSLLNYLAGHDAAIVTDIPGTTRDVMREYIQLDGVPLHIVDTAGLRVSDDKVEKEGVRRAAAECHKADRILLLVDSADKHATDLQEIQQELNINLSKDIPVTLVRNKIDLTQEQAGIKQIDSVSIVSISVKTGAGIKALKEHLLASIGYHSDAGEFMARRRHLDALSHAKTNIETGLQQIQNQKAGELLAEELRQAQRALEEITGRFTSDDLLGRIFSNFCLGK